MRRRATGVTRRSSSRRRTTRRARRQDDVLPLRQRLDTARHHRDATVLGEHHTPHLLLVRGLCGERRSREVRRVHVQCGRRDSPDDHLQLQPGCGRGRVRPTGSDFEPPPTTRVARASTRRSTRSTRQPFTQGTAFTVSGDGLHTFSYYSVDSAGNTETVKVSNQFRIDCIAPVSSTSAINGGDLLRRADVHGERDRQRLGCRRSVRYQLDSTTGAWTTGTSVTVPAPSSGSASHTLYLSAVDNAGNTETPAEGDHLRDLGELRVRHRHRRDRRAGLHHRSCRRHDDARRPLRRRRVSPERGRSAVSGGYLAANIAVTPGQTLAVKVGKAASGLAGGWGGGYRRYRHQRQWRRRLDLRRSLRRRRPRRSWRRRGAGMGAA